MCVFGEDVKIDVDLKNLFCLFLDVNNLCLLWEFMLLNGMLVLNDCGEILDVFV